MAPEPAGLRGTMQQALVINLVISALSFLSGRLGLEVGRGNGELATLEK